EERLQAVGALLKHYRPVSTLAFCNTKQQCRDLHEVLQAQGFDALVLNGDLEQRERDQVLIRFANRSCSVLVATDVAARGLDITQLEAVINVDVTPDPEIHIHRIGRTGRADEEGWALSLCTSPGDKRRIATIAQTMGSEPEWHDFGALQNSQDAALVPPMVTLQILGGRKEKIRPGDVLGALTSDANFTREQVGKITVTDQYTYVAVARSIADAALKKLSTGKVKGKTVKARIL
ncbi:MAG: ATP-independent helicase, partial [Proteobacteria bacterium]|nr:ATP-independent helicase [Pseudomonadota bacterium]